jgi:hypothetical protein
LFQTSQLGQNLSRSFTFVSSPQDDGFVGQRYKVAVLLGQLQRCVQLFQSSADVVLQVEEIGQQVAAAGSFHVRWLAGFQVCPQRLYVSPSICFLW